jgi:hypothetical protein
MRRRAEPAVRPRPGSWLLLLVGALETASLAACNETCICGQQLFITVRVVDAIDGGSISSALVNGLPCEGTCWFARKPDGGPAEADPVDLTVTAEGYRPTSLTVVVPATTPVDLGCCGLGPPWIPQGVTTPLQPL